MRDLLNSIGLTEVFAYLATRAALRLSGTTQSVHSLANELLANIQYIFKSEGIDKISTADLIMALCEDDENAWITYNHGQPLTPRQLARLLKSYKITSKNLRFDGDRVGIKGFEHKQFTDAFSRYLATTSENTPSSATPPQTNHNVADVNAKLESTSDKTCSVVAAEDPVLGVTEKSSKPSHLRV